ncbi:MerR family transcriptional regulator [Nocardia yamanashiensis]|uniref:MerR family transcriptional regulator n=1 Tax=Nocardia yamanashiensis TaxID=209247 RepID=UPI001E436243|nr:MerR family transcriptional regulator [Nocardia yamanashiensis]UGT45185.1 MerR family transcriptional regulator [Nocardia yamanashiensis]
MPEVTVLIGELAQATGVAPRLLRYYEEQGLLVPQRDSNGYRTYDDQAAARVHRIRELLDAGLNTRAIRAILPCVVPEGIQHCDRTRKIVHDGLSRLDDEIAALTRRRTLLAQQQSALHANPYDSTATYL